MNNYCGHLCWPVTPSGTVLLRPSGPTSRALDNLPELGLVDAKALASLVGVAPLVPGQRTKAGSAGHSRRPQRGSPRSVHLCLVNDPDGWRIAPLLSGTAPTWKAWEGCSGSGDAEVVAAAERRGPEGYTLGAGNCVKLSALHPCDGLDTKHEYCPVSRVHLMDT